MSARISELHEAGLHTPDEVRRLPRVRVAVPVQPTEDSSPLSEGLPPIVYEIHPPAIGKLQDAGVAALISVAAVLVIPIRKQHDEYFQAIQFAGVSQLGI